MVIFCVVDSMETFTLRCSELLWFKRVVLEIQIGYCRSGGSLQLASECELSQLRYVYQRVPTGLELISEIRGHASNQ
jgi:hypothetical protein